MNDNTISSNLTRIKDATDDIRSTLGTPGAAIEDVASDVATLSTQYNQMASDYNDLIIENNRLRQQIADLTPKGTINITQNGITNVSRYANALVRVPQDGNIRGIRFTDWVGDDDNVLKFNREDVNIVQTLSQYNTYLFTNGREMFRSCEVDSDDLTDLDTFNMQDMDEMFCEARPHDNTTFTANFAFSNVQSINSMFNNSEYSIIDLSTLDRTIDGMDRICSDCHNLIACYVPNMNVTGNFHRFFQGDENLQFVDIRSMEFHTKTNDSGYIFNDVPDSCIVVVKDQVEKDWVLNYYPNLDVQTVEEYESHEPWEPPCFVSNLIINPMDENGYPLHRSWVTVTDNDTGENIFDEDWYDDFLPLSVKVGRTYTVSADYDGNYGVIEITISDDEDNFADISLPFTKSVDINFQIEGEDGGDVSQSVIHLYEADGGPDITTIYYGDIWTADLYQWDGVNIEAEITCPGYETEVWGDVITEDMEEYPVIILVPAVARQVELQVINEDTSELADPNLIQLLYLDQFSADEREIPSQEISWNNSVVFDIEDDTINVHANFELADTENYEIVGDDICDMDIEEDYTCITFYIHSIQGGNE